MLSLNSSNTMILLQIFLIPLSKLLIDLMLFLIHDFRKCLWNHFYLQFSGLRYKR